jgi:hypothetical protein
MNQAVRIVLHRRFRACGRGPAVAVGCGGSSLMSRSPTPMAATGPFLSAQVQFLELAPPMSDTE